MPLLGMRLSIAHRDRIFCVIAHLAHDVGLEGVVVEGRRGVGLRLRIYRQAQVRAARRLQVPIAAQRLKAGQQEKEGAEFRQVSIVRALGVQTAQSGPSRPSSDSILDLPESIMGSEVKAVPVRAGAPRWIGRGRRRTGAGRRARPPHCTWPSPQATASAAPSARRQDRGDTDKRVRNKASKGAACAFGGQSTFCGLQPDCLDRCVVPSIGCSYRCAAK